MSARRTQSLCHPGCLRIMQEHQVTRPHPGPHGVEVAGEDRLVLVSLRVTQWAPVTRCPVQEVVQTLGDPEEPRVALQDQPTRIHTCPAAVGQQRREHLRDPATRSRRVHVPHDPALQDAPCENHVALQPPRPPRVQQPCQPLHRHRIDANLTHDPMIPPPAVRGGGQHDATSRRGEGARRSLLEQARAEVSVCALCHPTDSWSEPRPRNAGSTLVPEQPAGGRRMGFWKRSHSPAMTFAPDLALGPA